jgi:hypothetical protein
MTPLIRMTLLALVLSGCSLSKDTDPVSVEVKPTFLDAPGTALVPLNASDGLPVRVLVTATCPTLRDSSGLTAHVWLVNGVGESTTGLAASTDAPALVLEYVGATDGISTYAGTITLNAAVDGTASVATVTVMAEVDGATGTEQRDIQPPEINAGRIQLSPLWSGSVPRYAFCVETSASKGSVDLVASDPSSIAQQPAGAGTLLPGPCSPNDALVMSPTKSHTSFVVTYSPDAFGLSATLHGKPPSIDPQGWTTQLSLVGLKNPIVTLTPVVAATSPLHVVGGDLYTVDVHAQALDTEAKELDIEGLAVAFGSTTSGSTFTNTSVTTDPDGMATSQILVPFGAEVIATFNSAGGGTASLPLGTPAISITATAAPLPAPSQPSTSVAGVAYAVTAVATTAQSDPASGVLLTFASSGAAASIAPASATTQNGTASTQVVVGYGSQVNVSISGGGASKVITLSAPPLSPIANELAATALPSAGVPGQLYSVTASIGVPNLVVGFSTNASGISFMPASVPTNIAGNASSQVLVPFGTSVTVTATAGGNTATAILSAPPIAITAAVALDPASPSSTGGASMLLTAHAADADGNPASGVPLSFAVTTPAVASPTSVTTDSSGTATTHVFVPYTASPLTATITGGGGVAVVPLSQALPPLGITLASTVELDPSVSVIQGGSPVIITIQAQDAGGAVIGLALTVAATTGVSIAPTSVVTDSAGSAIVHAFVPYGATPLSATITGGGAVTVLPLSPVLRPVTLQIVVTPPSATTPWSTVTATAMSGTTPVQDVSLSFTILPSGSALSPTTVVTDVAGRAVVAANLSAKGTIEVSGANQFAIVDLP